MRRTRCLYSAALATVVLALGACGRSSEDAETETAVLRGESGMLGLQLGPLNGLMGQLTDEIDSPTDTGKMLHYDLGLRRAKRLGLTEEQHAAAVAEWTTLRQLMHALVSIETPDNWSWSAKKRADVREALTAVRQQAATLRGLLMPFRPKIEEWRGNAAEVFGERAAEADTEEEKGK